MPSPRDRQTRMRDRFLPTPTRGQRRYGNLLRDGRTCDSVRTTQPHDVSVAIPEALLGNRLEEAFAEFRIIGGRDHTHPVVLAEQPDVHLPGGRNTDRLVMLVALPAELLEVPIEDWHASV